MDQFLEPWDGIRQVRNPEQGLKLPGIHDLHILDGLKRVRLALGPFNKAVNAFEVFNLEGVLTGRSHDQSP
jgi:hypothetical protein